MIFAFYDFLDFQIFRFSEVFGNSEIGNFSFLFFDILHFHIFTCTHSHIHSGNMVKCKMDKT